MFCRGCGKELNEKIAFCGECGKKTNLSFKTLNEFIEAKEKNKERKGFIGGP